MSRLVLLTAFPTKIGVTSMSPVTYIITHDYRKVEKANPDYSFGDVAKGTSENKVLQQMLAQMSSIKPAATDTSYGSILK